MEITEFFTFTNAVLLFLTSVIMVNDALRRLLTLNHMDTALVCYRQACPRDMCTNCECIEQWHRMNVEPPPSNGNTAHLHSGGWRG